MTSIAAPLVSQNSQLRPLNIMRDLSNVADLVEKCFADTMDTEGRNYLQQMRRAGKDNSFLRWATKAVDSASMPLSGYVWEENGEIIGNASLIPYHHARQKYYVIANVAVRPESRNRGIGRELTRAAMQHATQRHADQIWLHVRDDNPTAIGLYRSLGFVEQARRTSWQANPDHESLSRYPSVRITRRTGRDWLTQSGWLRSLYPDSLSWYQPIPWRSLRPGLAGALLRLAVDYDIHHWVARMNGVLAAAVSLQTLAGRQTRIWAALPPERESDAEVLSALLLHTRRQSYMQEKISLDFPAGQFVEPIQAAGFHMQRTLLWMKSSGTPA